MVCDALKARCQESFDKFFDRNQIVTYIHEDPPSWARLASVDSAPTRRGAKSPTLADDSTRLRVPSHPPLPTWNEYMQPGFNLLTYVRRTVLSLTAILAFAAPVVAQTFASTNGVSAQAVISSLVSEGQTLEADGLWGEAIAHYESALREHPGDRVLEQRFNTARLHYSLERRLNDGSFRQSAVTLTPQQALDQYSDLLLKINTHYFDTPPWQELVVRGSQALNIALADSNFRRQHRIQPTTQQMSRVQQEISAVINGRSVRTRYEAATAVAEVARVVRYRTGLRQSATLLEFTSAAADGLDTYSAYLTANQLRDVYSQIEGNFVGLGVELKADEGALRIVHVIPGSPAERSGLLDDDRIIAIDGKKTADHSTDEAAAMLTGEEGSYVRVTVERASTLGVAKQVSTVNVRREHVDVPSLEDVDIIDPTRGVAYVKIPAFQKTTATDLEKALWDLHAKGMRSLIIDLRGNPGGLLTASVEIADKFVANGRIVSTRGRSQAETFDYRAHRAGTWRVPLVVLIDGDSASASEIFAAAIKDAGRGKIVGSRSYGKGSVQGIFPLGATGAGIRLTTAKFFSPQDRPISKVGVDPDIDTRRATQAVNGRGQYATQTQAAEGSHLVGYRGTNEATSGDETLSTAIEVASNTPVPVL